MKRAFSLILVLVMILGAAAQAEGLFGMLSAPAGEAQGRYEGPGYDSPQEAVLAYIEAFDRADVKAMLSTFAIESWAENSDGRVMLERMRAYTPTQYTDPLPVTGEYLRSLRVERRYASLGGKLAAQLNMHPAGTLVMNEPTGSVRIKDAVALDDFYRAWESDPSDGWAGHVEFVGWIRPDVLTQGMYNRVQNRSNAAEIYAATAGCGDCEDVIAHIRLNGQEALLFMTCGEYSGRWYNLDLGNMTSTITGMSVTSYGLGVASADDPDARALAAQAALAAAAPMTEGEAMLEANLTSPLRGSRWALTAIDGDETAPVILPDQDALDAWTGGEAAWGELRFTQSAYILRVRRSPAREQILPGGRKRWTMSSGVWQARGDYANIYDHKGEPVAAGFENGRITLKDGETGLNYTFEAVSGGTSGASGAFMQSPKLEGEGYDSPEAAVTAYIEAFNAGDARAMLSTFAVETWAERADGRYFAERMGAVSMYSLLQAMPAKGEYALQARAAGRYGMLADRLAQQYTGAGAPEGYDEYGVLYRIESVDDLAEFWRSWQSAPGAGWAGNVQFVEWISPAGLANGKLYETRMQIQNAQLALQHGCDDYTPVAAHLLINGRHALLVMDCGAYDGRWYNVDPGGYLGVLLGLDMNAGGLLISDSGDMASFQAALGLVDGAADEAAISANLGSGLVGTRWRLIHAEGDGLGDLAPAVAESADAARIAAGTSVYGELRFTRTGCLVSFAQSGAFRDAMTLGNNTFNHSIYVWTPGMSGATLMDKNGQVIRGIMLDGTLTYTDPDLNVTYTFAME